MYVPLVKLMSSGIFFFKLYWITYVGGIFLKKNPTLSAIFMVFSTVTKVQYFAKKVVGTPVFGIILREIYTMILVLIISRRSYDHLYHESHRYHIGGISTTRWRYRPGEQQIVPLRNTQYISTYGYFEIKYKTVRRIQNKIS